MTRQTESPPKRGAIHPKTGVQIGIPVKTQTKKVSDTDQWISRDARLWRTISLPTTTSSRSWAGVTARSPGRGWLAGVIVAPLSRSHRREIRVVVVGPLGLFPPVLGEVGEGADDRPEDRERPDRAQDRFPEPDEQ